MDPEAVAATPTWTRWILFGSLPASLALLALMIVDAARWGSAAFYYLLGAFFLVLVPVAILAVRMRPIGR